MSKQDPASKIYKLNDAATHPLAVRYGITTRQMKRAVQSGRLQGVKPGGLIWLFTSSDIEDFILGKSSDATKA